MTRERYCNIKASNPEDLLQSIDRNISNINIMQLDFIDNEDETATDRFYCNMLRGILMDMKEDVEGIMKGKYQ